MKSILLFLLIVIWFISTVILTISIIGLFLIGISDDKWFYIGERLISDFKNS